MDGILKPRVLSNSQERVHTESKEVETGLVKKGVRGVGRGKQENKAL